MTPYNVVKESAENNNLTAIHGRHAGAGRPGGHECLDPDR